MTILLGDIPSRPHYHQARPELLAGLRDKLLGGAGPVGVTGRAAAVGLEGMGGIGKTTLAADLCRLPELAAAFPGGVYWVTLGEAPMIELAQRRLIEWLGGKTVDIRDTADGRDRLQKLLIDRHDRCLIVLDDVWELVHVRELLPATEGCPHRQLITTRRGDLLRTLGAEEHRVDELSPDAARALLAAATGFPADRMPVEAGDIARECGYLPLALAIVGGALAGEGADIWGEVLQALRRGDHDGTLEQELPDYRRARHVFGALAVSVNRLAPEERERFLDLAVFPEDTAVPAAVFDRLWYELTPLKRKKLLTLFADRNLARRSADGAISLHDLQRDYLVTTVAQDLTARHWRLIDGYRRMCGGVWADIPDDGYGFRHLPRHLREAGEIETLRSLLFDPAWMIAKMRAAGVTALAGDYPLLPDDAEARLVGQALTLSAHVLTSDPGQLAGQLWGRLAPDRGGAIAGLLERAAATAPVPWLKPHRPTLAAPGGALICILQGHRYSVDAVAITADGKRGLSAFHKIVRFWDLETGSCLHSFDGYSSIRSPVAMTADGRRALSGSSDTTLWQWDLDTGTCLRVLEGHTFGVVAIAMTADGQRALSGANDHTLRLWDLDTGACLRVLEGHNNGLNAVAMTVDGRRGLSGSRDNTLRLWDLDTGTCLRVLKGHTGGVQSVAMTADGGRALSGSSDNTLRLWDLDTGTCLRVLKGHTGEVRSVAMTADGGRALSGSEDQTLRLWDLDTGSCLQTLEGQGGEVFAVAMTPDGGRALSGNEDARVRFWNLRVDDGLVVGQHRHQGACHAVATAADGRRVLSSGGSGEVLRLWDPDTGTCQRVLEGHGGKVTALAMTPDDCRALSGSRDGTLLLWDLDTGQCLSVLEGHIRWVLAVAMTPDGHRAVTGSCDKTVRLWDLDAGTCLQVFDGHISWVYAVAVTPDGRHALSGADDGLRLWDLETGASRWVVKDAGNIASLAITLDGRRFLSGSFDETVRLWDLETGACLHVFEGHEGVVRSVALMPDGDRVLSGSHDRTLRVWDPATGQGRVVFTADTAVMCCAVAGNIVVAGDESGNVHFFDLIDAPGD